MFEAGSAGCSGLRCRGLVDTQNHGGYHIPCVAISPMIRVFCFGFRSGYRALIVRAAGLTVKFQRLAPSVVTLEQLIHATILAHERVLDKRPRWVLSSR